MSADDPRRAPLLARRIPREAIVAGRPYLVHARNGGVGVAVTVEGRLGYRLRREKMGRVYLDVELDWSEGEPFGTAIPLRQIDGEPPVEDAGLLVWLAAREEQCQEETRAAWDEVLGPSAGTWRRR